MKKRPPTKVTVICQRRISDIHIGMFAMRDVVDRYCHHAASSHDGDGCRRCSCEGLVKGRDDCGESK